MLLQAEQGQHSKGCNVSCFSVWKTEQHKSGMPHGGWGKCFIAVGLCIRILAIFILTPETCTMLLRKEQVVINDVGKQPSRYTSDLIYVQKRRIFQKGLGSLSFSSSIFQTRVENGSAKLLNTAVEKASFQCTYFIFGCLARGLHRMTDMSSGQLISFSAYSKIPYALLTAIFLFSKMIPAYSCYPF